MSRVEIKQVLIAKEVLNTTDEAVLDQLKAVLQMQSGDWWKDLPAKVRRDVEESLAQADRGETVSHAEAMKQVQAWDRLVLPHVLQRTQHGRGLPASQAARKPS